MTCTYAGCTRQAEREGRCYAHQAQFVEACAAGEHCQCHVDGGACCTCGAKRDFWRAIRPGTFIPARVG